MIKHSFQELEGFEVCYELNTDLDHVEVYSVRILDVEVPVKSLPRELQAAILLEGCMLGHTEWECVD
jgi:hypothetical protein